MCSMVVRWHVSVEGRNAIVCEYPGAPPKQINLGVPDKQWLFFSNQFQCAGCEHLF